MSNKKVKYIIQKDLHANVAIAFHKNEFKLIIRLQVSEAQMLGRKDHARKNHKQFHFLLIIISKIEIYNRNR